MNIINRSIKGIIACPFRSFSIAVFIAVFTIVSMIGFFFNQINESYETTFEKKFGSTISLITEGKDVSPDLLKAILEDKSVLRVHSGGELLATAVNFETFSINNTGGFDDSGKAYFELGLSGFTSIESTIYFNEKGYKLIDGFFPKTNSNEVLIETSIAKKNSLHIGDVIEIEIDGNNSEFIISGIYTEPALSSSSLTTVFCDYSMLKLFNEEYEHKSEYTIYIDNKNNIARVGAIIDKLIGNDESYSWIDSISNASIGFSGIHSVISGTTKLLVNITYITALLILALMTYLWMRKHFNEAGIYIALGQRKISILIEFALEIIIISICSIVPFTFLSYLLVNVFGEDIVLSFAQYSQSNYMKQEIDEQMLEQTVQIGTVIKSGGMVMIVVLISTLVSGISILKYKATELFVAQE